MSRRRYLSTDISRDRAVNRLAQAAGPFAVLLYTWMIPHADDSGCLTGDPEEILLEVIPGFRDITEADVEAALVAMVKAKLIRWGWDDNGRPLVEFPEASFYRYQTYISERKRRSASNITQHRVSPKNADERRETPTNTEKRRNHENPQILDGETISDDFSAKRRKTPQNTVSPSPSPSPSKDNDRQETVAVVDNSASPVDKSESEDRERFFVGLIEILGDRDIGLDYDVVNAMTDSMWAKGMPLDVARIAADMTVALAREPTARGAYFSKVILNWIERRILTIPQAQECAARAREKKRAGPAC